MNTCKTCLYWGGLIYKDGYEDGMKLDGPCALINENDRNPARIAVQTDYPEFVTNAVVNTKADFGCIRWATKNFTRMPGCSCGDTPCTCPF